MRPSRRKQSGVVLFISLIILVAMSLAGIALIRSVDTSNLIAGNLAFLGWFLGAAARRELAVDQARHVLAGLRIASVMTRRPPGSTVRRTRPPSDSWRSVRVEPTLCSLAGRWVGPTRIAVTWLFRPYSSPSGASAASSAEASWSEGGPAAPTTAAAPSNCRN